MSLTMYQIKPFSSSERERFTFKHQRICFIQHSLHVSLSWLAFAFAIFITHNNGDTTTKASQETTVQGVLDGEGEVAVHCDPDFTFCVINVKK